MEATQIKKGLPGRLENKCWAILQGDSDGNNKQEVTSYPLGKNELSFNSLKDILRLIFGCTLRYFEHNVLQYNREFKNEPPLL